MQSELALTVCTSPPERHVVFKLTPPNDINNDRSVDPEVAEKHQVRTIVGSSEDSVDRDVVLVNLTLEKRQAIIKAWEESEKAKAEHKASKRLSFLDSWETSEKVGVETQLKRIQEKLEKLKAEYVEKMKNKIVEIHKMAEEKRAMVEASKKEAFLKLEKMAAISHATGYTPRKTL